MAIDDDTKYGLTGAQVKDLAARIKAGGGGAKVLTTDDYDWPTESPDNVAAWNLDDGIYANPNAINIKLHTSDSPQSVIPILTVTTVSGYKNISGLTSLTSVSGKSGVIRVRVSTAGAKIGDESLFSPKDSLTSSSATTPLSANQGKVLKGLIDALGTGKQDTLTAGTNITIDANNVISASTTGTSDYEGLTNLPQIENVTLIGNKSLNDLGIQPAGNYVVDAAYVHTDNNYTTAEKTKLSTAVVSSDISNETWTFTLSDNTTVTKKVVLWEGQ